MWSFSIYCNHDASWINPGNSASFAALLIVPNLIMSLLFAKIFTAPLIPVFSKLNTSEKKRIIEGKVGTLLLGIKDTETGQMKINVDGSVISLNVQSNEGKEIEEGDKVFIIEKSENANVYIVQKIDHT